MRNAGQIVRINLENFMTYDSIDIHPGNHLNLIIGPNGTGKSSVVCAVLLGLGGKLRTLGRAEQLGSYVKGGCDQCCIEIELHQPNEKNVVIKRKILINNQSEFFINGKISTANKVQELRKKLNIQIDNLCTFLPQEKVQDFAKLNPQQLLDETQRTVGGGRLVELHEELKVLQSKIEEQENYNTSVQNELENEKQKNERLKGKIKCFREKQSLCEKLVVLNQKKGWLIYDEEVKKKEEMMKDYKLAERVRNSKKEEVEGLNAALGKLEKELSSHEKKLSEARKNEAGKKGALEDWLRRAEGRLDKLEDLRNFVELKLKEEEEKRNEMLKHKETAEKLSIDLRTLEESWGSESELRRKREEVDGKLKAIHEEESRLNGVKVDLEEDEETLRRELGNTNRELERLEKRRNIRLELVKRREPDVYASVEWLEKNRDLFRCRVYNPMLLELDVPNGKMGKYVEAVVGYRDLISFTCTNADDLNLLIEKLRTEQKLKVNAICSEEVFGEEKSSQNFNDSQVPMSELKSYGFHSYLKDLITGPEEIIRFLCNTYGIHRVPVGDERVSFNCDRVPQSITSFCSEKEIFSVKYSIYSGEKSISVKKLEEAKFFGESLDESGAVEELSERKRELEERLREKEEEIKEVKNRIKALRGSLEEVKKKKRELATSGEEGEQIRRNLKRAAASYNSMKETLREPKEIEEEADSQRETLKKEMKRNLEEAKRGCEALKETKEIRQKWALSHLIKEFERNRISERKSRCAEELCRREEVVREMRERVKAAEAKCEQVEEKAKELTRNISKGERGFGEFEEKFGELPETVEEIEAEIVETQTKSEFLQEGSLEVLEEYEKREETIGDLRESLENGMRRLEKKKEELNSKQEEWLNPVNELVSKINENFGRLFEAMDCAGEISLVSGENKNDFGKYGIKILVKFREGTPFQELGRFFQSGGERAVATAVFMLSMQELTSVPFRFVDEINQGMDPENERRILQLIVRVTASEKSAQYFFITPKLLPDLKCSRTMTVLCIYNGPHAIPATEWDMEQFLGKKATSDGEEEEMDEDVEEEEGEEE